MAVYTHLSAEEIRDFVRPYSLGELLTITPIAEGIENTNYLLEFQCASAEVLPIFPSKARREAAGFGGQAPNSTKCKNTTRKAILTLFEKRVRAENIPFYMDYMAHLAAKGISCPQPYVAEGEMVRTLAGKAAVLISFLEGQGNLPPTPERLFLLGQEMARMHLVVHDFPQTLPNAFAPHQLESLYHKTAPHLDRLQKGLRESLAEEIELMRCWPSLGLPRGVIHADLFRDNVFFDHDRLSGIIDFYFAATEYFAYDLAIVLNAWDCDAAGKTALLEGYEALRPLSAAEHEALPFLARGAALRFLLTRAHDWFFQVEGAVVTPKDPLEYLRKWQSWKAANNQP